MNSEGSDAELGDCHDSATESTALLPERQSEQREQRHLVSRKVAAPPLDRVSLWLYHSSQFYFLCGCLINNYVVVVFYSNGGHQTAVTQTMSLLAYFLWVLNPVYDLFFAMRIRSRRNLVEAPPQSNQRGNPLGGRESSDTVHIAGTQTVAQNVALFASEPPTSHLSNGSSGSVAAIQPEGNGASMRSGGQLCGGTNLCMPIAFVVASLLYMAAVALPIYCSSNDQTPRSDAGVHGDNAVMAQQITDRFCDPDLVNLTNFAASLIMFCGAVSSCVACSASAFRSPLRQLRRCKTSAGEQLKAVMCFTRDSFSKGRHFLRQDRIRGARRLRRKFENSPAIEDLANEANYPGNATSVLVRNPAPHHPLYVCVYRYHARRFTLRT